MDRGITPGGFAMWWQRATSKVCVFTHECALTLSERKTERTGWESRKSIMCCCRRNQCLWITPMHADLFYSTTNPSTLWKTTALRFYFEIYVKLKLPFFISVFVSFSITPFVCVFVAAKKVSIKKSFHEQHFYFVLSSISLQRKKKKMEGEKKKAESTSANLNNELHFKSYNNTILCGAANRCRQ